MTAIFWWNDATTGQSPPSEILRVVGGQMRKYILSDDRRPDSIMYANDHDNGTFTEIAWYFILACRASYHGSRWMSIRRRLYKATIGGNMPVISCQQMPRVEIMLRPCRLTIEERLLPLNGDMGTSLTAESSSHGAVCHREIFASNQACCPWRRNNLLSMKFRCEYDISIPRIANYHERKCQSISITPHWVDNARRMSAQRSMTMRTLCIAAEWGHSTMTDRFWNIEWLWWRLLTKLISRRRTNRRCAWEVLLMHRNHRKSRCIVIDIYW